MLNDIRDRFLRLRLQRDEREIKIGFTITGLLIILLIGYVTYLNFYIIKSNSTKTSYSPTPTTFTKKPTPIPSLIPTPTPVGVITKPLDTITNSTKDYYINLGSGSNQSSDWTDVPGTLSTFNIAQYSNIKEAHLETNINVPTANGTVSVRLFNKTDNYAVWNSERTVQSEINGSLLISQNLIYDKGPKLYIVQMKSQLSVLANLAQARIHVIAQ